MRAARIGCAAISFCIAVVLVFCSAPTFAQTDSATVSGRVLDPAGRSVPDAKVRLVDIDRGTAEESATNNAGLYTFRAVHPGRYRMEVEARGFKLVNITGLTVNTQANLEQNFALSIGSVSESVTVEAKASDVSTSVNTVVDRQFVENLPLNGRSFQSLMQLTPGVVVTPTSTIDSGQFSVNGQRANANYFMVDGVSANIGASFNIGATQNSSGTIPGFSVLGGTNNLVSADDLQEFRIQTSTYAPEFGRTPGAQVSLETRSGTNQFHGTAFEYLRNDVLDASNWFNGTSNPPLKKSQERQNDFGGVIGGPIHRDKTFFFFSYEGEILRLPRTSISEVPSLAFRQGPGTPAAILPLLNAFPLPNQTPSAAEAAAGLARFDVSFSDQSKLNAASLRIDHRVNDGLSFFARYNLSPSELITHNNPANDLTRFDIRTETLTLGSVWSITKTMGNDLRLNYSRNRASGRESLDAIGGAIVPSDSFFLPDPFSSQNSAGHITISGVGSVGVAPLTDNLQRQFNIVESLSLIKGAHAIKFGVDYRRLSPNVTSPQYSLSSTFLNVASAQALTPLIVGISATNPVSMLFHNLGAYAQDTWRLTSRITMTYGLRWDVDFAPSTAHGPNFLALVNVDNPATLALAPPGSPVFATQFHNVAPRLGVSYLLHSAPKHETVLRGGGGVFYDLATQQTADLFTRATEFPFGVTEFCTAFTCPGMTFPIPSVISQPPAIAFNPGLPLFGFDPHLGLPYTLQWNTAVEQSLGDKQVVSATYVGSVGRGLIQQQELFSPPNTFRTVDVIGNHATSDYHALQLQFLRQISHGLQVLASYTWAHSIDSASSSALANPNLFGGGLQSNFNRSSSDFDIRHGFSAAVVYDVPSPKESRLFRALAGGWSMDNMIQGRSATPVDVESNTVAVLPDGLAVLRPDFVPGQPLYLFGADCAQLSGGFCAGGKMINPRAFVTPPTNPATHLPQEGNVGRNALRGFAAFQWDFAANRTFRLRESLRLSLRAELFNVLNHPNFANPNNLFNLPLFGRSTQTLNQGLSGSTGTGFSSLYQIGGPRSAQLVLKLQF